MMNFQVTIAQRHLHRTASQQLLSTDARRRFLEVIIDKIQTYIHRKRCRIRIPVVEISVSPISIDSSTAINPIAASSFDNAGGLAMLSALLEMLLAS